MLWLGNVMTNGPQIFKFHIFSVFLGPYWGTVPKQLNEQLLSTFLYCRGLPKYINILPKQSTIINRFIIVTYL